MPTELAVQDHVFQAMHLYPALCAKRGLQLLLGEYCCGFLPASPHPSHALELGDELTPTIHGFPTSVDLLLAPITPDQSLQHRA